MTPNGSGGNPVLKFKEKKKRIITVNAERTERSTIRWLMVVYDSILYAICCAVFFGVQPSLSTPLPYKSVVLYPLLGYVLLFGFRFLLKCYNQIWRYGSAQALLRDIIAGVSGDRLRII